MLAMKSTLLDIHATQTVKKPCTVYTLFTFVGHNPGHMTPIQEGTTYCQRCVFVLQLFIIFLSSLRGPLKISVSFHNLCPTNAESSISNAKWQRLNIMKFMFFHEERILLQRAVVHEKQVFSNVLTPISPKVRYKRKYL